MALPPVAKYIIACLTCQCWCSFYMFLNAYIRACNICIETIQNAKNTLFSILACCFFLFCFGVIECIFCVCGIIYLFQGPCQQFASSGDFRQGYQNLVKGDNFPIDGTIRGALKGIF